MALIRRLLCKSFFLLFFLSASAQRTYKANSVLASGNWYRISVSGPGVYKIDLSLLNKLGISGNIPSNQLRLFGNGGGMLPEANSAKPFDDLQENAVMVEDGGDGVLNGSDYVLFYAEGPDHWEKDSLNRRFRHKKNLYSDKAFYFLTIGGSGLRIPTQSSSPATATTVSSFDERYFHELDTVNFLSSGKEWFGEEFSDAPGRLLTRTFQLPVTDQLPDQSMLITSFASRSVKSGARFTVTTNNVPIQQVDIPAISTALYDVFARQAETGNNVALSQNAVSLTIKYTPGGVNSQGWLNWFEFFCRSPLKLDPGRQLSFRDWRSIGSGNAKFSLSTTENSAQVWDVTDPLHPVKMKVASSAGQAEFSASVQDLHEYIGFSSALLTPTAETAIANQNLHATTEKDLLIVTSPALMGEAQRIANFHSSAGLRTLVVTTDQVFNEYSGGMPDPVAIRDFARMYYDRFRTTWAQSGKYLLLMGKGSFDYKNRMNNNTNLVPVYESSNSLDPLSTYTSDDFFGFLDETEDINATPLINQLDIGIGRIPAKNAEEAKNFVDKLFDYHAPASFGPWRNNLNFIADDEDLNLHLQDAESLAATTQNAAPVFNVQKIYLDAFRQEGGSAGGRYPAANAVINSNIYNGTLIWNFSGHGGPTRLAEEVVIDQQTVNSWNNRYRLPLFITATCDFAPYDNPILNSLGENLLVRPRTGAIALMTTSRVVFAFSNRILNNNYLKFALEPDALGRYRTLGEALTAGKNFTYQTSGDIINNRKFSLMGDPAMTLAFPQHKIKITAINGKDPDVVTDTLGATEDVIIDGEVRNNSGSLLNDFTGTVYLSVFDKVRNISTLGNDPTSPPTVFQDQENALFRGKASAQAGKFSFRFRMPKDINYQYGNGRISLYAQDGIRDGNGFSTAFIVGGIASSTTADNEGPKISAYLNDEKFVNGTMSNSNPVLIVKLSDSSGINTGSGVGHDIVATLDKDNSQYFVLNNFFESDVDNYRKGSLRFQLPTLAPGPHCLEIKAWDVLNNSNVYSLQFTVVNNEQLKIDHVYNYPNPFSTHTSFWFEHNYPGSELLVRVEVYTLSGRLIKRISETINTPGNRSSEVGWDGRDEFGQKIGRGVYVYHLSVRTITGKSADKWERLVLLGK